VWFQSHCRLVWRWELANRVRSMSIGEQWGESNRLGAQRSTRCGKYDRTWVWLASFQSIQQFSYIHRQFRTSCSRYKKTGNPEACITVELRRVNFVTRLVSIANGVSVTGVASYQRKMIDTRLPSCNCSSCSRGYNVLHSSARGSRVASEAPQL